MHALKSSGRREGVWCVAHIAFATKIKRIWVTFDIMEWVRLVSLERKEGTEPQDAEEGTNSDQRDKQTRIASHLPKEM